jgi:hypothetical protein
MQTNLADSIRRSLQAVVSRHVALDESTPIMESTLIRNGSYCGRRFSLKGFSLVWFQEEGQVKLYNPFGTLEQSTSVAQFCMAASESEFSDNRRVA